MALRIKKQYKQTDGTIIEVEGTESEIESFEKKQQKIKQTEEKARTKSILYGKDLEDIRRIIAEELAKRPVQEFHSHYEQKPYWYTTTADKISLGTVSTTPLPYPTASVTWTASTGSYTVCTNTDSSTFVGYNTPTNYDHSAASGWALTTTTEQ